MCVVETRGVGVLDFESPRGRRERGRPAFGLVFRPGLGALGWGPCGFSVVVGWSATRCWLCVAVLWADVVGFMLPWVGQGVSGLLGTGLPGNGTFGSGMFGEDRGRCCAEVM